MNTVLVAIFSILCIYSTTGSTLRYMWMPDEQGNMRLENLQMDESLKSTVEPSDVTFYLFTTHNLDEPEEIRADNFHDLTSSHRYDPHRKNVFILHGWTGNWQSSYIKRIGEALLSKHHMNIFAIDWSRPAGLGYMNAVNEVIPTGKIISDFAKQMMHHYSITPDDFLLIGHSLGGQLIGSIGAHLDGEVDTIVALDPAGPLFNLDNLELSLDPSDAKFVHVIHTNNAFLGFPSPCGHADYFPNGGYKQVGCGTDGTGQCSHGRANDYYIESILTNGFKSVKCDSQEDFENGLCTHNESSHLGHEPVDKSASGSYYLNTNEESPFSMHH